MQRLPEDAIPPDLLVVEEEINHDDGNAAGQNEVSSDDLAYDNDTRSFLPYPVREGTEDKAIRSIINGEDPFDWPAAG